MSWDPAQYLSFADLRLRPAIDLLARVPHHRPGSVVDLGCGTGAATRLLRDRWPDARIAGIDGSPEMLAKARLALPGIDWAEGDFAAWRPSAPVDVLYSNAALHWTGDHAGLFPRLFAALAPGGALAVQMPRNFSAPSHALMRTAAEAGPWWPKLAPLFGPPPVGPPELYYRLLAPLARHLDIWETEYLQVLDGDDPVAEWTKGTWLRPLLDRLDHSEGRRFEDDYRRLVRAAYPKEPDGRTLFPFRRLFIVAGA